MSLLGNIKKISFILITLVINSSYASADEFNESGFHQWVESFKSEAQVAGISQGTIDNALGEVKFLPRVIELDRSQPDKVKTFEQYIKAVLPAKRVKMANEKYKENKVLLDKIGKKYGVQPRFIVSLWAIESNFGQNMGGFKIVDSLATLAYEGRRADFFKDELLKALKILDEGHITYDKMVGSWAGAMGQTQFMPSSFLNLAVDYDGDGKKDIWNNKSDAFASIANYLSKTGWDNSVTWGRKVKVPSNIEASLIGKDVEKTLKEWHSLGITKHNGGKLPARNNVTASLIRPEDDKNDFYLVYKNYKTILKWNRSLYFATAVGVLSDKIRP